MLKIPTVNPLFKYIVINNKFVPEKWVNGPHLSINQKNFKNLGLKQNIN